MYAQDQNICTFVLLESFDVESICPRLKAPHFIICHHGVIYKLCDPKLSSGALFIKLGSVKVHTSNVSPKIGFCNKYWTNKLY